MINRQHYEIIVVFHQKCSCVGHLQFSPAFLPNFCLNTTCSADKKGVETRQTWGTEMMQRRNNDITIAPPVYIHTGHTNSSAGKYHVSFSINEILQKSLDFFVFILQFKN
jgi:hypothetical protein